MAGHSTSNFNTRHLATSTAGAMDGDMSFQIPVNFGSDMLMATDWNASAAGWGDEDDDLPSPSMLKGAASYAVSAALSPTPPARSKTPTDQHNRSRSRTPGSPTGPRNPVPVPKTATSSRLPKPAQSMIKPPGTVARAPQRSGIPMPKSTVRKQTAPSLTHEQSQNSINMSRINGSMLQGTSMPDGFGSSDEEDQASPSRDGRGRSRLPAPQSRLRQPGASSSRPPVTQSRSAFGSTNVSTTTPAPGPLKRSGSSQSVASTSQIPSRPPSRLDQSIPSRPPSRLEQAKPVARPVPAEPMWPTSSDVDNDETLDGPALLAALESERLKLRAELERQRNQYQPVAPAPVLVQVAAPAPVKSAPAPVLAPRMSTTPLMVVRELSPEPVVDQPTPRAAPPPVVGEPTPRVASPSPIQEARRASVQPMTTESDISGNDEAPPPAARRKTRSSVAPPTPAVAANATPVANRRQSRVSVAPQQAHHRQPSVTAEPQPAPVHRRQSSVSTEPQRRQSVVPAVPQSQPEPSHRRASINQVQTIDFSKPPASVRRSSRVLQQSPVRAEPSPKPAPAQRPRRSTMHATRVPIEPTPPPAEEEEDQVMDEERTPVASRKSVSPRKSLARGRSVSPRKSMATRRSSVAPPTPAPVEEEDARIEHARGRSTPRFQASRVPIVAEAEEEDEDDVQMLEQPPVAAHRSRQSTASRKSTSRHQEDVSRHQEQEQEHDVDGERMEDIQHDEPEPVLPHRQPTALPRKTSFKATRVPIVPEPVEPAPSQAQETQYSEEPAPSRRVSAISRQSSTTSAASSHRSMTNRNTVANTSMSRRAVERLREPSFAPEDAMLGTFVDETIPNSFFDERDSQSRTVPSPVLPSARTSVRQSAVPAHRSTSPQLDATNEVPSLPSVPYDASRSALASVAQDSSGAAVSRRGSVASVAPSRRESVAVPSSRRPSNGAAQSSFGLPVASSTMRVDALALEDDDDDEEPSFSFAQHSRLAANTNANKSINTADRSTRTTNEDFSTRTANEDFMGSLGPPAATSTLRKERQQHRTLAAVFAENEGDASRSFAFTEADVSVRGAHQEQLMRFNQSIRADQSMQSRADQSMHVDKADLSMRSHKADSSIRRTEADQSMRSQKAADRSVVMEADQSMRSHQVADQSMRSNRAADRSHATDADISVRTTRAVDQSMRTNNVVDQSMRSNKAAHQSFATDADLSMTSGKAADRSTRGKSVDRSYATEADLSVRTNRAAEHSMRSNHSRVNERSRSVEPSRMQLDDDEDVSYDYAEEEQHLQRLDAPEPEQHRSFAAEASRADRSWTAPANERYPAAFDDDEDEPVNRSMSRTYSRLSPEPVLAPAPAPAQRRQRSPSPPRHQERPSPDRRQTQVSPARPQRTSTHAVELQPRRSVVAADSPPRGRRLTRDAPPPDSARSRSRAMYQAVQESRVDDMFARRVRDGNKQRGLDLSSHSTRGRSNYSGGHASFEATERSASRGPVSMDDYIGRTRSRAGSVSRPVSRTETYSRPVSRAGSIEPTRGRPPVSAPAVPWTRSTSVGPTPAPPADTDYRPASRAESRERSFSRSGGYAAPTAASIRRATSAPPDDLPLARSRSRSVSREPSRTRPPVSGMPAASKKVRPNPQAPKTAPLSEHDINKTGGSRLTQATAASKGKANRRTTSGSKAVPQPKASVEKPPAAATRPATGGRLTQPTKASSNKAADAAKVVSARTAPKGILKAKPTTKARTNLPPSHFRRSVEAAKAQPSGSGARTFLRAAVDEADAATTETKNGEGLGDVIAKYGEKLLGAAGLTWIKPTEPEPQAGPSVLRRATRKSAPSPAPREQAPEDDGDDDDSESEPEHDPHRDLTLADLSPRKRRDAGMFVALSSPRSMSPIHPASKRGSDTDLERPQESFKRARLNPPSSPIPASSSPPLVPAALPISRPVSRAGTSHSGSQRSRARSQSRERSASRTRSEYEWGMPGYDNKQRVLEKLELDRMRKELEAQARRDRPEMFAPEYLPPPPVVPRHVQPTVAQPFTFASDARGASRQRPEDFESRRQVFEQHERAESVQPTGSSRSSSRAGHAAIIPDFAAIHASNAAALAAKRPKIQPTIAHSPALNTASRARDRDRYDIGAREREQQLAEFRHRQRQERELEEERAYREARRRAVTKAHAMPDWYADAPRRAGEARQRDVS